MGKILVYGLGKSAYAAIRYLQVTGYSIVVWDESEEARNKAAEQGLEIFNFEEANWVKIKGVLKAPGVPQDRPILVAARDAGVPRLSDIDMLFERYGDGNVFFGITGTNGKSTTTALAAHVLKTAGENAVAGGNIGIAALDLPKMHDGFYVLELSSFQCEDITQVEFGGSVLLNLTPDHLDRYSGMGDYLRAKINLMHRTKMVAPCVINIDQHDLEEVAEEMALIGHEVVKISTEGNAADIIVDEGMCLVDGGEVIADLNEYPNLPGRHNGQNIAAVWGLVRDRVMANDFREGLRTYQPLEHRTEFVGEVDGVKFINDSKATNADASIPALNAYKNIYWIVGGKEKSEGVVPCLEHVDEVKAAFVIGVRAAEIGEQVSKKIEKTVVSGELGQAVKDAYAAAKENGGGVVLFSPACASFDQFTSFEARGDAFKGFVKEIL